MKRQGSVLKRTQRGNPWQSYGCNKRVRNWRLTEQAGTVLESGVLGLKLVFGAEVFDLGLSDIQLRLSQFDDRSEAEIVAALREILR
jgi:hypothetical protein